MLLGAGQYAKPENFDQFTALIEDFALQVTQTIKSPTTLAQMMASKARLMAKVIELALNEDDKAQEENHQNTTDLQGQLHAFKNILIHDINNKSFADIYAQTIAYGLFAARYHDPTLKTFSRQEAATLIPQSNPFLRKLFQYIAGYELDNRLTWLVDELVQIFLATDVASVMNNFGKSTRQHDPIIHFYETFLAEYDPKLRKSRGVWYTPEPVVSFIVRAVDDILKTHFKLPQGLADTSKTKVTIEAIEPGSKGKLVKKERELHRVQILDPATGTGTFLAQTIRHIYDNQFASMNGAWSGYVKDHLIPRLNGFELLMTSYAMAHLKLDMLLTETGYQAGENAERLRIYLTNSLEEYHADTGTLFASWLSTEANEANHIKRDAPVMVVMGNPPYSVSSSNKSDWILKLIGDYKKDLNERNIQPLSDDYIKFIRYGQHFIDKRGEGVLAYISNNSFIDGLIHRQMRKNLLESFDEIYILDLHGNSKKQETSPDGSKDDNVFDIMQGVSINLLIKTGKKPKGTLGKVFHHEFYGKREAKYTALHQGSISNLNWQQLDAKAPEYFFAVKDFKNADEYLQGFKINELFQINNVGIATGSDSELVSFTNENTNAQKYLYRPFDHRFIVFDRVKLQRARYETMKHLAFTENNIALQITSKNRQLSTGYVFIANTISDRHALDSAADSMSVFPLYTYLDNNDLLIDTNRTPNLNMQTVELIATGLNLTFTAEKLDQSNTFSPMDLLDYIYAVLHSPKYRETYKEFLKIDFPRVPYPNSTEQFWQLVSFGGELRKLHLLEGNVLNQPVTNYPQHGNNVVDKTRYEDGKVFINESQYFDVVPKLAWEFYIGGYQPAQKWLKDRKGRVLGFEDILHYQKMIKAMVETDRLMQEIDIVGVV